MTEPLEIRSRKDLSTGSSFADCAADRAAARNAPRASTRFLSLRRIVRFSRRSFRFHDVAVTQHSGGDGYTLYRNSALDSALRIHVATFDADESGNYNQENCEVSATLFHQQPGVTVKYRCEKGRYRP